MVNPQYQRLEQVAHKNNFSTVAALFKQVGITKTNAYYIRDNKQKLSFKTAEKVAKLCNVSAEWLMNGTESNVVENDTAAPCKMCKEKDKIIEDLRELNFFLRENYQRVKKELDELQLNIDKKSRKTA